MSRQGSVRRVGRGHQCRVWRLWRRQDHPDEDTAALSEDERLTRFAEWIEKDPSVIGRAIHHASHSHNRAYWRRKRARMVSVQAGDIELNGIIRVADIEPVPGRCVQPALF